MHLSVILFTGEYLGRYPPQAGTPPWASNPPGRYTAPCRYPPSRHPPEQVHPPPHRYTPCRYTPYPLGRYTPWAGTPPGQCMLGYGQQAGGTHPTGMHSCCMISFCSVINTFYNCTYDKGKYYKQYSYLIVYRSEAFTFSFLQLEHYLGWYRHLLEGALDFQRDLGNINLKNCIGTVLAINGPRK